MLRNNSRNGITRNGNRPQRIGDQLLFFYFGQKQEETDRIIILYARYSKNMQKKFVKYFTIARVGGADG